MAVVIIIIIEEHIEFKVEVLFLLAGARYRHGRKKPNR
jgi:hypothetical protein